jgi:hypothetical protein
MIQVVFKDLHKSELAKEVALERIEPVVERFPALSEGKITVTLSMQNSPNQAGPDLFTVKVFCRSGRYRGLAMEKSGPNLYVALADVAEHMLERLNRFGDRARVKGRERARRLAGGRRHWNPAGEGDESEVSLKKNS